MPGFFNPFPFANHPHWVVTDLTLPPGAWAPRNTAWSDVLVSHLPPTGGAAAACSASAAGQDAAYQDQLDAINLVQDAYLDQLSSYATTKVPFGVWQQQPGCNFSGEQKVSDFTGSSRPHWMDYSNADDNVPLPSPDAPVYMQSPGASVFKMICINCHGPNADSNGRLAQNLATMSGGLALVADFRDGIFGPVSAASSDTENNRSAVFGVLPSGAGPNWTGASVDDRAARYMAWMGLGGTVVRIPLAILELVAVTKVLDQHRTLDAGQLSANMLSQAKALCISLLAPDEFATQLAPAAGGAYFDGTPGHGYLDARRTKFNTTLIASNGDGEMWLRLCTVDNPPPIHVLSLDTSGGRGNFLVQSNIVKEGLLQIDNYAPGALMDPSLWPTDSPTPIGNDRGGVDADGLQPHLCAPASNQDRTPSYLETCNKWPWCVDIASGTKSQQAWVTQNNFPVCPQKILAVSQACKTQSMLPAGATCYGNVAASKWAVRGAVNAGMSVFTYVRSIEGTGPDPDYNQCGLLK
jgi:hypothetical protein